MLLLLRYKYNHFNYIFVHIDTITKNLILNSKIDNLYVFNQFLKNSIKIMLKLCYGYGMLFIVFL